MKTVETSPTLSVTAQYPLKGVGGVVTCTRKITGPLALYD